jgi:hypothetical protein
LRAAFRDQTTVGLTETDVETQRMRTG